jgi:hypothetical protein
MKNKIYTTAQVARMVKRQGCMSVHTHPGMRVVFTSPKNGHEFQQKKLAALGLTVGQTYTVKGIDVGQSSTSFELEEFPGEHFNSVNFCNLPKQQLPEGIHNWGYLTRG